jgi:hypothetical protein
MEASVDPELIAASRYFSKRVSEQKALEQSWSGARSARLGSRVDLSRGASQTESWVEWISSRGFHPGLSWERELRLRGIPGDSSATGLTARHRVIKLRYSVMHWRDFPEAQLELRISAVASEIERFFIEQRLSFSTKRSEFRRCDSRRGCGPWISFSSETLCLAGEDSGLGWEQGPVLLSVEALARAKFSRNEARFDGEDFFGRPMGFRWERDAPWPSKVENAQGVLTLEGAEGGSP